MGRANSSGTVRQRDVELTERQSHVLRLITEGKTNAEIGEALGISLDGAKWHVSEILSKLDVATREEAAEYWRARNGLRSRTLRALRSLVPGLGWLKVAGGVAVVASVSAAAIFVVVALRDSGTSDTGPLATAGQPSATATTASSTAASIPAPRTKDPTLESVLAAVENQNSVALASLLRPIGVSCDDDIQTTAPDCEGSAVGTTVPSIYSFQCQDGWVSANVLRPPQTLVHGRYQLYSISRGGPLISRGANARGVDAWLVFRGLDANKPEMMGVAVLGDGVVAFGYSCGDSATFIRKYADPTSTFIVPPSGGQ